MSFKSNQYAKYPSYVAMLDAANDSWDSQVKVHTCEELLLISQPGNCTIVSNGNTVTFQTPAFIWNRAGSYHFFSQLPPLENGYLAAFYPQIISEMPKDMIKTDFLEDSALFILPLSGKHEWRFLSLFQSLRGSPYFQRQLLFPCIFHQVTQALAAGFEPIRSGNIND